MLLIIFSQYNNGTLKHSVTNVLDNNSLSIKNKVNPAF